MFSGQSNLSLLPQWTYELLCFGFNSNSNIFYVIENTSLDQSISFIKYGESVKWIWNIEITSDRLSLVESVEI